MNTIKKLGFLTLSMLSLIASCGKNKTLFGYDIDLATAAAEKLGVKVEFQQIVWEQKEIELASKYIDLIWNGLTITDARKDSMILSDPYMANTQVVLAKTSFNKEITSASKFNISYEIGSAGNNTFQADDIFKNSTGIGVSAQIDALTEVASGTSDLAIIDSVMAGY